MDPDDVELDENYTIETRSKCKIALDQQIINRVVLFCFSFFPIGLYFCMRRLLFCVHVHFFYVFTTDRSTDRIPKTWIPIPNSNRLKIKPWKLVADVNV